MNLLPDVLETELSSLIFDVSEANGGEPFDTLSDALNYADNVLLDNQKKGGMTIKYVQTSDNKYVQFFLNNQTFTTNVYYWEKVNLEKDVVGLSQDIQVKIDPGYYFEFRKRFICPYTNVPGA